MKAAQYFGNRDVRIVEIPEPVARSNQALVSVEWGGICGTDVSEYVAGTCCLLEHI